MQSAPAAERYRYLHYSAPQAFATAGTLDEGGKRIELVSLPRSFDPQGGALRLELSSSLAGALFSALDVLEHVPLRVHRADALSLPAQPGALPGAAGI